MRALLGLLLSLAFSSGCTAESDAQEQAPPPLQLEPKRDVLAPADFHGPIDPEWPPKTDVELEVALRASQYIRERLAEGNATIQVIPPPPGDTPGLHVESGKIGPFSYLEVIVGEPLHPDDTLPLVVLLHGRGNKPQIPQGPFDSPVPFRMFLPQAPDPLGEGFTWLATPTLGQDKQLFARSLSGRVDQLAPAIEAFRRLRPTFGKPIVAGFSQGGILTFTLATRYPDYFSAAFPMAGWLPPALYPVPKLGQRYPYIFAQHGDRDTVVPIEDGRATVTALRARGLTVDFKEAKGVGHVVTPEMNEEVRRAVRRILNSYASGVRTPDRP